LPERTYKRQTGQENPLDRAGARIDREDTQIGRLGEWDEKE